MFLSDLFISWVSVLLVLYDFCYHRIYLFEVGWKVDLFEGNVEDEDHHHHQHWKNKTRETKLVGKCIAERDHDIGEKEKRHPSFLHQLVPA